MNVAEGNFFCMCRKHYESWIFVACRVWLYPCLPGWILRQEKISPVTTGVCLLLPALNYLWLLIAHGLEENAEVSAKGVPGLFILIISLTPRRDNFDQKAEKEWLCAVNLLSWFPWNWFSQFCFVQPTLFMFLGTKAAAEYTNGVYDMVSPAQSMYFGTLQILHLLEDLKMALEMLKDPQEREALRNQIPGSTAACIHDWLEENLVSREN